MRRIENLDVQMLICLETLIMERSITRTAERLGISQPSVSRILAQLRDLANDPLLVRTARGMEPTPRGIALARGVHEHLMRLESLFDDTEQLELSQAKGEVTITSTEGWATILLPHLVNRIRTNAPAVSLRHRHFDFQMIHEWLETGACDIGIGQLGDSPSGMFRTEIARDKVCCIVSQNHPTIRERLSLDDYVTSRHVAFHHTHASLTSGDASIDLALASQGYQRQIAMRSASPLMAGAVVAETDLVATISERLATQSALRFPVRIFPLPFPSPELPIYMVWHERTHRNALCKWIRQSVVEIAAGSP